MQNLLIWLSLLSSSSFAPFIINALVTRKCLLKNSQGAFRNDCPLKELQTSTVRSRNLAINGWFFFSVPPLPNYTYPVHACLWLFVFRVFSLWTLLPRPRLASLYLLRGESTIGLPFWLLKTICYHDMEAFFLVTILPKWSGRYTYSFSSWVEGYLLYYPDGTTSWE